jgi:hypothetical protein
LAATTGVAFPDRTVVVTLMVRCLWCRRSLAPVEFSVNAIGPCFPAAIVDVARPIVTR